MVHYTAFLKSKPAGNLPSISTIARVADKVDIDSIRDVGNHVYKMAREKKMLSSYCGMWIAIVDGHEITTSAYCKCNHCRKRKLKSKDGSIKYQYYHSFTAFILAGGKYSFVLDIEPILPGES
ncbi:MAG: hypothetical protein FJW56_03645 [Actinobacteria bacterium]|nr:hypothetical protein [Actinomycetota bacterium]